MNAAKYRSRSPARPCNGSEIRIAQSGGAENVRVVGPDSVGCADDPPGPFRERTFANAQRGRWLTPQNGRSRIGIRFDANVVPHASEQYASFTFAAVAQTRTARSRRESAAWSVRRLRRLPNALERRVAMPSAE